METYIETINRYIVEELDIGMSDERRADLRINGIDPDNNWRLKWSFTEEKDAQKMRDREEKRHKEFAEDYGCDVFHTYRVRDLGETKKIERQVGWF